MDNLTFVDVDNSNYKTAINLQHEIFPYEKNSFDILESVKKVRSNYKYIHYYLIKTNNKIIGFTGLYSYDLYPDTAWIAWAGLLPKYNNIESKLEYLNFIKTIATNLGYNYLRVFSDEIADADDNKAYEKFGMIKEFYTKEKNKFFSVGKTLIYSISLSKKPVSLWKNKLLYLEAHEQREQNNTENNLTINTKNIIFVPVNQENSKQAIKIQQSIFPLENGKQDILESLKPQLVNYGFLKYYLINYEEKYIGIIGLYSYHEYPQDGWIAWFGILSEYRRNHIGSLALEFIKKEAKKEKFQTLRVYTDSNLNHYACHLYDKFFENKEIYNNEKNKYYSVGDTLIYSLSLNKKPVTPWNDKSLFLEKHEQRNNKYVLKFVPINEENLELAAIIQYKIFNDSHSCGYLDYKEEVKNKSKQLLPLDFLVYYKKNPVGVIGLYEIPNHPDDIWLNWFGVLPEYRKHGFGTQFLLFALEKAKELGKTNFRLFTYAVWHSKAQGIYKRTMTLEENYNNKNDDQYCIKFGKPKIFSINLKNKNIEKWRSKFIDLASEKILHYNSIQQMLKDDLFKKHNL